MVESNLAFRENAELKRFLVFGESGMDLYVQDLEEGAYGIIDSISLDRFETYNSFHEMLATILRARLE